MHAALLQLMLQFERLNSRLCWSFHVRSRGELLEPRLLCILLLEEL